RAPLSRPNSSHGSHSAKLTTDTSSGSRVSVAASNGSAVPYTPSPRFETPDAAHSLPNPFPRNPLPEARSRPCPQSCRNPTPIGHPRPGPPGPAPPRPGPPRPEACRSPGPLLVGPPNGRVAPRGGGGSRLSPAPR